MLETPNLQVISWWLSSTCFRVWWEVDLQNLRWNPQKRFAILYCFQLTKVKPENLSVDLNGGGQFSSLNAPFYFFFLLSLGGTFLLSPRLENSTPAAPAVAETLIDQRQILTAKCSHSWNLQKLHWKFVNICDDSNAQEHQFTNYKWVKIL